MGFFDKAKGKLAVRINEGASPQMQSLWRSLPAGKKNQLRSVLHDSDRDGVPDKFDCQPFNPKKQDDDRRVVDRIIYPNSYPESTNQQAEKPRVLRETIPWSKAEMGEAGLDTPGMEIEIDGDKKQVRVYKRGPVFQWQP